MAQLDISSAAFSGFKVIRRSPVSPVVWGILHTVLAFLPLLLIGPTLFDFFQTVGSDIARGVEPDQAEMMRLSTQLNIVQPISWICQLLATGLVTGAMFRAVLHPENKRWFYMRVGMAEVMLVAVSLVFTILATMAFVIAALIIAIPAVIIGLSVSPEAGVMVGVLLGLVAAGVLVWACLRFSISLAMSHDKKQFLLFESWKLTSGHAGGLFGMGLLSFIVGWLISLLVVGVLMGVGAGLLLGGGGFEALQRLDDTRDFSAFFTPERVQLLIGYGGVYLFVASILQGYIGTIMAAPWAEAYRQLVPPVEETV